jgi:hypothetical protein
MYKTILVTLTASALSAGAVASGLVVRKEPLVWVKGLLPSALLTRQVYSPLTHVGKAARHREARGGYLPDAKLFTTGVHLFTSL